MLYSHHRFAEDVLKVRFFSKNNQPKWEAYGNFENRHFHGTEKVCSAIRLAYPRYENPDCTKPHIQVSVELILEHKKGPDTRSDPVCFTYHSKPGKEAQLTASCLWSFRTLVLRYHGSSLIFPFEYEVEDNSLNVCIRKLRLMFLTPDKINHVFYSFLLICVMI